MRFFLFFSSRRRHTRFKCDWSSDVCSSDLFETSGEFFGVWERVKTMVPTARERFRQKLFLANLEKAAQRFEKWMKKESPGSVEAMREWTQQMRSEKAKKASA